MQPLDQGKQSYSIQLRLPLTIHNQINLLIIFTINQLIVESIKCLKVVIKAYQFPRAQNHIFKLLFLSNQQTKTHKRKQQRKTPNPYIKEAGTRKYLFL